MDALTFYTLAADPLEATNCGFNYESSNFSSVWHLACALRVRVNPTNAIFENSVPLGKWAGPCNVHDCPVKAALTQE